MQAKLTLEVKSNRFLEVEVVLKSLAPGMEEAVINYWYFEEGDSVNEGAELVEVVSETGTYKITAPLAGVLGEVYFPEGETVEVGEVLCEIEKE